MRVVFTTPALADLDEIVAYTSENYPQLVAALEQRVRAVLDHVRRLPRSAPILEGGDGVRAIPLIHYPYRIFYRIEDGTIQVLHIHHTSRRMWR
jgi:addiction module RelE/StbE family toxin